MALSKPPRRCRWRLRGRDFWSVAKSRRSAGAEASRLCSRGCRRWLRAEVVASANAHGVARHARSKQAVLSRARAVKKAASLVEDRQ